MAKFEIRKTLWEPECDLGHNLGDALETEIKSSIFVNSVHLVNLFPDGRIETLSGKMRRSKLLSGSGKLIVKAKCIECEKLNERLEGHNPLKDEDLNRVDYVWELLFSNGRFVTANETF